MSSEYESAECGCVVDVPASVSACMTALARQRVYALTSLGLRDTKRRCTGLRRTFEKMSNIRLGHLLPPTYADLRYPSHTGPDFDAIFVGAGFVSYSRLKRS